MNDSELDTLLGAWEAPAPSKTLRSALRARFPREPRAFRFRPRWVLAAAVLSFTLAIAAGQGGGDLLGELTSAFHLQPVRETFMRWVGPWQAHAIFKRILDSDPKVYIDGEFQPNAQLRTWHAATMWIDLPGEGPYLFSTYRDAEGPLLRAGGIHGNVIEFRAGAKQVRIECSSAIVTIDRVIFAIRKP